MKQTERPTSNASEKLPGEVLNLTVRERYKVIALQEVKNALAEEVHDNADVAAEIEAIPQVYTPVAVLGIVGLERCKNSEFYLRGITVFLDRADDLDGNELISSSIFGLHNFAKGALPQQFDHLICESKVRVAVR